MCMLLSCCFAHLAIASVPSLQVRRLALSMGIPTVTTIAGARATASALRAMRSGPLVQVPLQDFFPDYYDDSL